MKTTCPLRNFKLQTKLLEKFGRQYAAAFAIGITEDRLSGIIHGRRVPTEEELRAIERLLGCDRAEFLPESPSTAGNPRKAGRGRQ